MKNNLSIDNNFVTSYLPLIRKIARNYTLPSCLTLDDLIQEGCIGLLEAAKRFDPNHPSHHATFSYYATCWIHKYIRLALHQYGHIVSIPRNHESDHVYTERLDCVISVDNGEPLTYEDILPSTQSADEMLIFNEQLNLRLQLLNEREQLIFLLVNGIGVEPQTKMEIADLLHLSYERVRVIYEKSCRKMRSV